MNRLQRQLFPDPSDPFSFSPPDNPTTAIETSLAGPLEAAVESPLLRVSPENINPNIFKHYSVH